MNRLSNYDKLPSITIPVTQKCVWQGWRDIVEVLRGETSQGARRIAIECYPGVYEDEIVRAFAESLAPCRVLRMAHTWKPPREIDAVVAHELTTDPVFGRMNGVVIDDFVDPVRLDCLKQRLACGGGEPILIIGTGTALIDPAPHVLVYADLARWEIQRRQRAGRIGNLAADNLSESPSLKYKRGFFLDG